MNELEISSVYTKRIMRKDRKYKEWRSNVGIKVFLRKLKIWNRINDQRN